MQKGEILVALCQEGTAAELFQVLDDQGYHSLNASLLSDALIFAEAHAPDGAVIGTAHGHASALHLASHLRRVDPLLPMVLVASDSSESLAISALRAGFNDYIPQSQPLHQVVDVLSRVRPKPFTARAPPHPAPRRGNISISRLLGGSASMNHVRAYIVKVARTDSTVLITGETGTGKELVASMIHHQSARADGPFLCLNCAAIPDSLLESELFGYDKGAFTGAQGDRPGAFQEADGGTLFLDEIGDMSLFAQAKILRAIELGSVQRLGGQRSIPVNVRIIAATNHDLWTMVQENHFRKDFYFRINVGRVHLPPLRERPEDIWPLLDYYFRELNASQHQALRGFPSEEMEILMSYAWPGNVRELRNLVEAIFISDPPKQASLKYLPQPMRLEFTFTPAPISDERQSLLVALAMTNGNVSEAARTLSCSRMTLYRRMRKYGIEYDSMRHNPGGLA